MIWIASGLLAQFAAAKVEGNGFQPVRAQRVQGSGLQGRGGNRSTGSEA